MSRLFWLQIRGIVSCFYALACVLDVSSVAVTIRALALIHCTAVMPWLSEDPNKHRCVLPQDYGGAQEASRGAARCYEDPPVHAKGLACWALSYHNEYKGFLGLLLRNFIR